jgi:hypothetical protein
MSPHPQVRSRLKYPRRIRRMAAVLAAAAAAVALAAPVSAAPLDGGRFHDEFSFVDPDFCGAGLAVLVEGTNDGRFMFNKRGATGAFTVQEHFRDTYTNLDNDAYITDEGRVLSNDIHVTDNGDGTITVLTQSTGPFTLYDSSGRPIARNSGLVRDRFVLDYNDTLLFPDDDIFISGERVLGSTGTNDDFCEAALAALT